MRASFLVVLVAAIPAFFAAASPVKGPAPVTRPVDHVLVDKSERRMWLLAGGTVVRTYPIALGPEPVGHKRQEGDGRTPEGLYRLDWRNPESCCHKSLHISYPDATDVADAAERGVSPGGMIMIHGQINGTVAFERITQLFDWTKGCIAVTNADMDEIWHLVPDGTPIELRP